MSKIFIEESTLTNIADAIREKTGETALINVSDMSTKIQNLEDNSVDIIGRKVSEINNSKVTTIGDYAFYRYSKLTNVSFPACTSIGAGAFQSCSNLASVGFPNCTTITGGAFNYCSKLADISFPVLNSASEAFYNCESLRSVDLPLFKGTMMDKTFALCDNLSKATFSSLSCVGIQLFYSCGSLMSFINTYSRVASMPFSTTFYCTPMEYSSYTGSFGSIYVPASLVNAYKNATNWATFADRITAISE